MRKLHPRKQTRSLSFPTSTLSSMRARGSIDTVTPRSSLAQRWCAMADRLVEPVAYMTVKEAIREQEMARLYNQQHRPATVRLPPSWSQVHAKSAMSSRQTPGAKIGFPRAEDGLLHTPSALAMSCTSSVGHGAPASTTRISSPQSALGGSTRSGLNHTSTYIYGEHPMKPALCGTNQYSAIGSYSMFGSQVRFWPSEDACMHSERWHGSACVCTLSLQCDCD
jgi:hypothetical protein